MSLHSCATCQND